MKYTPIRQSGVGASPLIMPPRKARALLCSVCLHSAALAFVLVRFPLSVGDPGLPEMSVLLASPAGSEAPEQASDGAPTAVEVLKSSGYVLLDQAAVRAVKGWSFRPALEGTRRISTRVEVPVRFSL